MRLVTGNKESLISLLDLSNLIVNYQGVEVDLGCGDGGWVYKKALVNPKTFYIGVDPAGNQMVDTSKKALKKRLKNVLFVIGSYEILPAELLGVADRLTVILPWGSLLAAVAKPTFDDAKKFGSLLKSGGVLEVVFGYSQNLEPTQAERLNLDTLDLARITTEILPIFIKSGFGVISCRQIYDFPETTWGKKLHLSPGRPFFNLVLNRVS
ncbi:hypothetical protein A3K34_03770 [candidate division WWE3 bacterium RIFOXYC1_FULL_40_10]|uniref:Methyltransferase domain-containing protein n=1 Tax=candidate division WWE3 bacterium RIFOXYA2_FULL_46_9 TaxID=1802636 RepID=A0A1F4W349_UNCKA|nr:MAG: hypothetical protein A3K58_03770 [candidate division WWE3 bacterium RIFOXYB1_FULL_40_22]OGC61959.1 MAG: hypothetical protein A3K37_03770 [candidate division WWE3 bacterium RIFOXYA1_FULL_40_11]OGC63785.1 MAG: hypothetical protein A2264_02720 [candidate division WWE3 bacterium RIFOXYA2_FULL_46_9]OGC64516.1 MAG: hypothetical protein A2326_03910 [candidate division WWE3 bacterium RIFOXYB2_FULL_41_6]OGC66342.1 MAG: hypothetical protein A3K34_03770 [candidate division WWE3 bacterium RIFOXYC1_